MSKLRYPNVVRGKNRVNLEGLQRASQRTQKADEFFIRKFVHEFNISSSGTKLLTLEKNEMIESFISLRMIEKSDWNIEPAEVGIGTESLPGAFAVFILDNQNADTTLFDIDTSGPMGITRRSLLLKPMIERTNVIFSITVGDATKGSGRLLITTLKLGV